MLPQKKNAARLTFDEPDEKVILPKILNILVTICMYRQSILCGRTTKAERNLPYPLKEY